MRPFISFLINKLLLIYVGLMDLWRPYVQAACMASLQTFLREKCTSTHDTLKGMSARVVALENWRSNMFDGQWFHGPIPKTTTFS